MYTSMIFLFNIKIIFASHIFHIIIVIFTSRFKRIVHLFMFSAFGDWQRIFEILDFIFLQIIIVDFFHGSIWQNAHALFRSIWQRRTWHLLGVAVSLLCMSAEERTDSQDNHRTSKRSKQKFHIEYCYFRKAFNIHWKNCKNQTSRKTYQPVCQILEHDIYQ